MRCWGLTILTLFTATAAEAAELPREIGEVSLSQLQAVSSREASYALDERWSLDVSQDAGAPNDAYVPATPIDESRTRSRLVLSLDLAHKDARMRPFVGAGIEDKDFERFSPATPYETSGNDFANFAATVVGGFNFDAGDGWSMKFKADMKKVGLGMKYKLN